MKPFHRLLILSVATAGCWLLSLRVSACIWDADTLKSEVKKSTKMADAILNGPPKPPDPAPLLKRIEELKTAPKKEDPAWWNNLAGAYLRLGKAQEAADLLAPVVAKFPDDYGLHANLGTAYHLLGLYAEAEKEIARDLEINPDAHFGLEKYHLALLQYLMRDKEYQKRHVYIDEFTSVFWDNDALVSGGRVVSGLDDELRTPGDEKEAVASNDNSPIAVAWRDVPPTYRYRWKLAGDEKLQDGLIYMATLNPNEPACFVALGVKAAINRDKNLAIAAFERAVKLGSPQSGRLQAHIGALQNHITKARENTRNGPVSYLIFGIGVLVLAFLIWLFRRIKREALDY